MSKSPRPPWILLALAGLCACQIASDPQPAPLPWLYGMSDLVASDQVTAAATRRLDGWVTEESPGCGGAADHAIQLVADVAPAPGVEAILASYARGVLVLDREGDALAFSPGYLCEGSADQLELVAAGRAFGVPTIIVVGVYGGHRAHVTFASLFRIGHDRRLDPVFTAVIAYPDDDGVRRGAIHMLPDALIYQSPDGRRALHVFDPVARAYLSPLDPLDDPQHEPPAAPEHVDQRRSS